MYRLIRVIQLGRHYAKPGPETNGPDRVIMSSPLFGPQLWIRGFVYKEWVDFFTGEPIRPPDFNWRPVFFRPAWPMQEQHRISEKSMRILISGLDKSV